MNEEITKEHNAYLDEAMIQQVKIVYDEYWNSWHLMSQGRRKHVSFKGETLYHYVGRETHLLSFMWLAGKLFVKVNHSAARRNVRGWERSLVESLLVGKKIKDFVKETFDINIDELYWSWVVDATRIRNKDYDWFETHDNPIGYVTLADQASDLVDKVQKALMAKEYLERSEFETFAKWMDPCIKEARSRLKEMVNLEKVSIFTDPKDLPESLLNADDEKRIIRLASFTKLYEKWMNGNE